LGRVLGISLRLLFTFARLGLLLFLLLKLLKSPILSITFLTPFLCCFIPLKTHNSDKGYKKIYFDFSEVVELVYTADLGSVPFKGEGSNPFFGIFYNKVA
jgi:hypothetical protein